MPPLQGLRVIDWTHILAALHRRSRDREAGRERIRGEWLDVGMHQVALTLSAPAYASHAVSGIERKATRATAFSGNPLSGTFATAQGFLAVVCNSEAQSKAFLRAMQSAGVEADAVERLAGFVSARDVDATHAWLEPVLRRRTAVEWEVFFRDHEVPAAEALTPAAAYDSVKSDARLWPEVHLGNADGRRVRVPGAGFVSTEPLMPPLGAPPLRGEHTREVLRTTGMDEATLDAAIARGAARVAP